MFPTLLSNVNFVMRFQTTVSLHGDPINFLHMLSNNSPLFFNYQKKWQPPITSMGDSRLISYNVTPLLLSPSSSGKICASTAVQKLCKICASTNLICAKFVQNLCSCVWIDHDVTLIRISAWQLLVSKANCFYSNVMKHFVFFQLN